MKRYKSIDIIRGLSMIIMVYGHIIDWWLTEEDYWLFLWLSSFLAPIGASGFIFVSGTATAISYKTRISKIKISNEISMNTVKNSYIIRALLLLIIAFIYNLCIAIAIQDLTWIWAWFVLLTIGFCLLMAWPLLRTSKIFRILCASGSLVANFCILEILLPFEGQANVYGIIFHFLYNPINLYPIFAFFPIFIIGTVIGDIIFEINSIDDEKIRKISLKNKLIYPLYLLGVILTIFSIIFLFPSFLYYSTFSAMLYSLGIIMILISFLIGVEEFEVINLSKSYHFFYYYSYYSFTIFLAHNPLYFLFYRQLNVFTIWIAVFITIILLTLLLKIVYERLGPKASLQVGLTIVSLILALKLENRKKSNYGKIMPIKNWQFFKKVRYERKD